MAHESFVLDDLDLRIIHALQIEPRARWSLVGAVVDADPTTVMRRWNRLTEAGAAWIACIPALDRTPVFALIDLRCAHGRTADVAAELAADPHTVSVNIYAGACDVFLEVMTKDHRDMSRFVLERLATVDGIREVRTNFLVAAYREAAQWRLGHLDAVAEQRLAAVGTRRGRRYLTSRGDLKVQQSTPAQLEIARMLADDPRIPVAKLALELGVSAATAGRRLDALLAGQPLLRCELAQTLSEWPVAASLRLRCPASKTHATAQALSTLREVRGVLLTTGPDDLVIGVWLRSIDHVHVLESRVVTRLPHVEVTDRSVLIRPVKQAGQLLDEEGWRIGSVPIDFRRAPLAMAEL